LIADRLTVLVLEMKRSADPGDRGSDRRSRTPGKMHDGAEHQNESAEEGAEYGQDAGSGDS
jgi:hypothetical protein